MINAVSFKRFIRFSLNGYEIYDNGKMYIFYP